MESDRPALPTVVANNNSVPPKWYRPIHLKWNTLQPSRPLMLSITVALYCPVLLGAPMRNCDVALLPTSLQCKSRSDVLAWYYANEQVAVAILGL